MSRLPDKIMKKFRQIFLDLWPFENLGLLNLSARCQISRKLLSHPSAHMVNLLLRENWKTIPKFLSGKKLLKMLPSRFKFYPSKLTVNVNFVCFHCIKQYKKGNGVTLNFL